jgi:hypothetical protein
VIANARNPKEAGAPLGFSADPDLAAGATLLTEVRVDHGPKPTTTPFAPTDRGRSAGFRPFHPKVSPEGGARFRAVPTCADTASSCPVATALGSPPLQ